MYPSLNSAAKLIQQGKLSLKMIIEMRNWDSTQIEKLSKVERCEHEHVRCRKTRCGRYITTCLKCKYEKEIKKD